MLDEIALLRQRPAPRRRADGTISLRAYAEFWPPIEQLDSRCVRWIAGVRTFFAAHLGDRRSSELLAGRPERPGHESLSQDETRLLDWIEGTLTTVTKTLEDVLQTLPAGRSTTVDVGVAGIRLDELRASRLIDGAVLDGFEQRAGSLRTPRSHRDAFLIATGLLSAVFESVLERLQEPPPTKKEPFDAVAKRVRRALAKRSGHAPLGGEHALNRIETGLNQIEQALAELRNSYSWAHPRRSSPVGVRRRHARLALDLAETYARYLVATLEDLGLL